MTRIGGYELIGRVGAGTTSTVWKAVDPHLDRDVALKQVIADPAGMDAFLAEAARLAMLDDDHIVSIYAYFSEGDAAYLVEEWIDGATLSAVLAAGGRFTTQQSLGVCRGALVGLGHAHGRNIVHGDVSASNILIDTDGVSRLIDFGPAASGTPAYRGPELAAGQAPTPASDVYAAAAVLTHLLTGAAAQPPDTAKVDPGLRPVLDKALAEVPSDRYRDAGEFLAALEEAAERRYGAGWWTQAGVGTLVGPAVAILTGGGTAAPLSGSAATAVLGGDGALRGRRRPGKLLLAGGAAAALVVVGGVVAVASTGGDDEPDSGPAASTTTDTSSDEALADEVVDTSPEATQPSGATYVVSSTAKPTTLRDGSTAPNKDKSRSTVWTFQPKSCTDTSCAGTISSSSGNKFKYVWDGTSMDLVKVPAVDRWGKQACTDDVTGETMPIREAAASYTYHYKYEQAGLKAGAPGEPPVLVRWKQTIPITYEFFGTCHPAPDDPVAYNYMVTMKQK